MKVILVLGAIAALGFAAVFFSFCPRQSFAIGAVIGVSGSGACHAADLKRAEDDNPTEKVLKGGI